jgi:hypothetical protein
MVAVAAAATIFFSSCGTTFAFQTHNHHSTFSVSSPTTTELRMNNKRSSSNKTSKPKRAKPKGFAGALRDLQLASFSYAGSIRPGTQSPQKTVEDRGDIMKPDYSDDGTVRRRCRLSFCIL